MRVDPLTLVDPCYSVAMFKKAYNNIVYPCKDRLEWQKMNGPPIEPPDYQKHVGRPCKSRRKSPEEIICGSGGKRMSRHGVIMHCSYCGEADHNRNGCRYLKAGLPPPNASVQQPEDEVEDEPIITQEHNTTSPTTETVQDLLVDQMIQQVVTLSMIAMYHMLIIVR